MKKAYFIIAMILLVLLACDRFEHSFQPKVYNLGGEEFARSFKAALNNLTLENLVDLESFYAADYTHSGMTASEKIDEFRNILLNNPNAVIYTDSVYVLENNLIKWNLFISDSRDTTAIKMYDYYKKEEDNFKFYGDQQGEKKILVELFTGTWCTYCPYAEGGLHELRSEYSSKFLYLEYHLYDFLQTSGNEDIKAFYMLAGSLPLTIVNGNTDMFEGANADTYKDRVKNSVDDVLSQASNAEIVGLNYEINGNDINFHVTSKIDEQITNAKIRAVIIEDYDEVNTNYNGDHMHNVVKWQYTADLDGTSGNHNTDFSCSGLDSLPEDITIIVWIQRMDESYNQETCKVYNVISKPILK